jgi:serine/threonine protein kinase
MQRMYPASATFTSRKHLAGAREDPGTQDLIETPAPTDPSDYTTELPENNAPHAGAIRDIDDFQPGKLVRDRYQIEALIGEGGFARVYRARDLRRDPADGSDVHVALKVLRPPLRESPPAIARLKREFRQTHGLPHPNIVRVFDLDSHDNSWFMVMELLDGETLRAHMNQFEPGAAPLVGSLAMLGACAGALGFAHDRGIAHGDFKPTNVIVLRNGDVRIIDFGSVPESVQGMAEPLPAELDRVATLAYASPQVAARNSAVPGDDVFSFACVACELLCGTHPLVEPPASQAKDSQLSPQQMDVLRQGMAWQREDRPHSIREFFNALATPPAMTADDSDKVDRAHTESAPTGAALADGCAGNDASIADLLPTASPAPPAAVLPAHASRIGEVLPAPIVPSAEALPRSAPLAPSDTAPRRERHKASHARPVRRSLVAALVKLLPIRTLLAVIAIGLLGFVLFRNPGVGRSTPPIKQVTADNVGLANLLPAAAADESFEAGAADLEPGAEPTVDAPTIVRKPQPVITSTVSFDTPAMTVTRRDVAAPITLRRVDGRAGPVQIAWRLVDGTAQAGRDIGGPTSGIAEFADLQQLRTLFVPLNANAESDGLRTFIVEITAISSNVAIGPIGRINVTILDAN